MTADSRAAVCSLLVQSLLPAGSQYSGLSDARGGCGTSMCTEIKDRQSLQLLRVAGVADFIIANELSSLLMVHLAREPLLSYFWSERANYLALFLSLFCICMFC